MSSRLILTATTSWALSTSGPWGRGFPHHVSSHPPYTPVNRSYWDTCFLGDDFEAEGSRGTVAQLERGGARLILSLRDSWSCCVVHLQASLQSPREGPRGPAPSRAGAPVVPLGEGSGGTELSLWSRKSFKIISAKFYLFWRKSFQMETQTSLAPTDTPKVS